MRMFVFRNFETLEILRLETCVKSNASVRALLTPDQSSLIGIQSI